MSIETEKPPLDVQRFSDGKILEASRVPFVICGLAIVALIALLVIQATTNAKFLGGYVTETDSALVRFMLAGSLYIGLFVIALASAYIGYWPAPGSADTELGVLMEPEVCHGETEVYTGVQA